MSFIIEYDPPVLKFLKKLDTHIAKRIIDKIESTLPTDPVPHNAKTIVGKHGVFRIRIGDYRALYRVNYALNKIVIVEIDLREKVFD